MDQRRLTHFTVCSLLHWFAVLTEAFLISDALRQRDVEKLPGGELHQDKNKTTSCLNAQIFACINTDVSFEALKMFTS